MIRSLIMLLTALGGSALVLPLLAFGKANDEPRPDADISSAAQSEAAQKFRGFLDADWKRWMEEYPEHATVPGQALAYKLGQLKIRELRSEAERRLGAKFNI